MSESGELILFDNEFKCLFDYDCKSEEYLLKEPGNQIEHNSLQRIFIGICIQYMIGYVNFHFKIFL